MAAKAKIVRSAEQASAWFLTDQVTALLTGEDTAEHLGVTIARMHPGGGTPPHIHRREDEAFYIIEGEVTFLHGEQLLRAGPGTFVWGPRDVIHCFKCTSATPAAMVMMVTPTHFLRFAAGFSTPGGDFDHPPEVSPEKLATVLRTAPDYGIEMRLDHPLPTVVSNAAGASKRLWVMGERVSYLATGEQTGGQFTVVEILSAPGGGPPPHTHTREDEIFFVISGRHEVGLDDRIETVGPGDLVYAPRGTRHRYTNLDATPGKLLSIHTPGGFEKFFDECGVDASDKPTAPPTRPLPEDALAALLQRHGMTA